MVRLQEAYLASFQRVVHSSVDIICPPEPLYVLSPSRFTVIQTTLPVRIGKFLADATRLREQTTDMQTTGSITLGSCRSK
jgi:hypothetical protein